MPEALIYAVYFGGRIRFSLACSIRWARRFCFQADEQEAGAQAGGSSAPFHAWALYRLRFVIAADLCAAWIPFGGLSSQHNNLSIIPHLATTESIAVALARDSIPPRSIGGISACDNRTAGSVDFMDMLHSEQQRFKIQAI